MRRDLNNQDGVRIRVTCHKPNPLPMYSYGVNFELWHDKKELLVHIYLLPTIYIFSLNKTLIHNLTTIFYEYVEYLKETCRWGCAQKHLI